MEKTIEAIIQERRTIRQDSSEAIAIEVVNKLLGTAAYAPFHSKTEPWQVYLLQGEADHQSYINEVLACYRRLGIWQEHGPDKVQEWEERLKAYFERVPLSMIVTCQVTGEEKADFEAVLATAAFIQNLQLLAWNQGLGVTWRTTAEIFDSTFTTQLNIPATERIVGSLQFTKHVGKTPKAKRRRPLSEWVKPLQEQEHQTDE